MNESVIHRHNAADPDDVIKEYIMTNMHKKIDYKHCVKMAEAIYEAYHKKQLPIVKVAYEVLKEWVTAANRVFQARENLIINEHVADIIQKIRYYQHIDYADPPLVQRDNLGTSGLKLINGNNTVNALEQVMRLKYVPGLKEISVAVIPDDMLPKGEDELEEVLKLVATMMNRQPKVVRGMSKSDIRDMIARDHVTGKDIQDDDYQKAKSQSAHIPLATVRELVSKVLTDASTAKLNAKMKFRQLAGHEVESVARERLNRKNFVQIAVVTKDKIFGTLSGAIQAMVEHDGCESVHIVFYFKNFSDISLLKTPTKEKIEKMKKIVKFPVTYEFLDEMQFVDQSDAA
jgi:hypothetical protein